MPNVKYAQIAWITEDVIENAKEIGLALSKRQADSLLRRNEMEIMDVMVQAGWTYIESLLPAPR
ncbi:MAG: hypothetical protein ACYDCD_13120 [Candidatus Acidiferrales bacterium]